MEWKLDCKVKVFLSSTFKDLIEERGAVEAIIHRMAEHYIGMEHWGSFNAAPLDQSLEMVRQSDVLLLVLADRYGFIPPGASESITELEYRAARAAQIPVLPYFRNDTAAGSAGTDAALEKLKEEIRFAHGVSWFRSPDHLASMAAADLARQVRTLLVDSLPFVQEVNPDLMRHHDQVNAELSSGRWDAALELCDKILKLHPRSPRCHYNRACALSRLSEQKSGGRSDEAQKAFISAMDYGMVQLISFYLHKGDPLEAIRREPDLEYLFRQRPGLVTQYLGADKRPRLAGLAAHGTCVAAETPVHLPRGRFKDAAKLMVGEPITSWHPDEGCAVDGVVQAIRKTTVAELLCINRGLRLTPSHPVLTDRGWLPAGELSGDTRLQLASGRFETVRSVEIITGESEVVDLSVAPWASFVVAGVVVHNKYPADLLSRPDPW
jgi:hypothetical protein